MIPISKTEKEQLMAAFPPSEYPYYVYPCTMKRKSKRKRYFCVEAKALMEMLGKIRKQKVVEEHY